MGYMLMYCMIMKKEVPYLSLSSHHQCRCDVCDIIGDVLCIHVSCVVHSYVIGKTGKELHSRC